MNELALGKTRFSLLARLRLVKFSVNVEHARVNKQPSHLHGLSIRNPLFTKTTVPRRAAPD